MFKKFFDGQADIAGNLTQDDGRDVSSRVAGSGGSPPVRMAKLLMATLLANLDKLEVLKDGNDFRWC